MPDNTIREIPQQPGNTILQAARLAAAEGLCQRHQGARRNGVRRRHGRLGCERASSRKASCAQTKQALENIAAVLKEGGAAAGAYRAA